MYRFYQTVVMIQGHYYRIRRIAAGNDRYVRICDNLVNDIFQVVSGLGKIYDSHF
jgi:hypothetical protein